MARDWADLFIVAGELPAAEAGDRTQETGEGEASGGFFRRLRDNLSKTREALSAEVQSTLLDQLDHESWERLEEALIYADVGARTTAEVVERLEREATDDGLAGEALRDRLVELLAEHARPADGDDERIDLRAEPTVIMVVGVNGTGKTTSIGKLAAQLRALDRSVVIGAADTYRAAAVEQLAEWARRAECEIVTGADGSDPGAVAYDTVARAQAAGADVAVIDTAGRLHTREDLMAELAKVGRAVSKQLPGAPHEVLLVIDATTGQNGVRQARLFADVVDVTGIVLTKLDGTAKGGIALAIAGELGIPVKLIGVGEGLEDLQPFDPEQFARALVS